MALGHLLKIPVVSDYIFDADFDEIVDDVVDAYELPEERADELLQLINAVLDDVITVKQMPALLEQAFAVDSQKATEIALDLVGEALLPLAAYLPEVEKDFLDLGGDLSKYSATRVPRDQAAALIVLQGITDKLELQLTEVLMKRLLFLAQQLAKKEKTEEVFKTFLTRSVNIGGLGLNEAQATALVAAIVPEAEALLEVTPKVPEARPVEAPVAEPETALSTSPMNGGVAQAADAVKAPAEAPIVSEPAAPVTPKKPSKPLFRPEDEPVRPTPDARRPLDEAPDRQSAKKAAAVKKVAASIEEAFAEALVLATELAAPTLKKKKISEKVFGDIAGKAIRGIRDIYQTRDLAERDLGLQGADLAAFMEAVTRGVDTYHEASRGLAAAEAEAPQGRGTDESAVLDRRFAAITANAPKERVEPELPGARVSAARTKEEELTLQADAVQMEKVNDAPPRAKAQLTVGSVPVQTSTGQRRVVDVVSAPRLVGPVEQLGGMTPAEFRRLSSDAAEAAQKIEDLLASLEAHAYEDRVKGVVAWRESPINQLYLRIAEEALAQRLALPEVSSRRRAAGKESLSPAEIKALARLNAKIRF